MEAAATFILGFPILTDLYDIRDIEIGHTYLSVKASERILCQFLPAVMEPPKGCQCSMGALQIMNELRSVHTVVELETILDLVERIQNQGQAMLKCKDCRANPGSSLMILPTLADRCLSLFEAACLAYNITRKNTLFDPAVLAFEQPLPQFLCIRSKMQLGQMELDEGETGMLVRMLLEKNLMKLLELLEALRSLSKEGGQSHRIGGGGTTLRGFNAAVESTTHRLADFMEQMDLESVG